MDKRILTALLIWAGVSVSVVIYGIVVKRLL